MAESIRLCQTPLFPSNADFNQMNDIFSLVKVQEVASYLGIGGGELLNPIACVTENNESPFLQTMHDLTPW
jgi:hypothetical protein